MADEPEKSESEGEEEAAAKSSSPLPWILVTVLAGGGGVAVPFFLPESDGAPAAEMQKPEKEIYEPLPPEETTFVDFEEVVVNLDEGALTRYLRVRVALEVAKEDEVEITQMLEDKRVLLKNWLINRISDKALDEIRGAAGQNRLRREIRNEFNSVLFPDGFDRIFRVLFDEYNVQ